MGQRLTFFDFIKVLFSLPVGLIIGTSVSVYVMLTDNPLEKKLERIFNAVRYISESHLLTMFSIFFWLMVVILW